jgi:hypothetical protein
MNALFLNAGLAAGVALATIPVIIHLFFRQTPKHVIFPALRLIKERQKRSRKRLKVKNWLLLLARMALIALMALALARPRLWSRTTLGDAEVPAAMALVFDTSLSMGYQERDKTRLDEAKDRARAILAKAHEASRVTVIDSAEPVAPPPVSPAAARKRIDELAIRDVNRPLNAAVGGAYRAVAGADQPRREVYVLTDLARTAWEPGRPVEGLPPPEAAKGEAAKAKTVVKADPKAGPQVAIYVVRLAPKTLRNTAVLAAEPAATHVAENEPVPLRVRLRGLGPASRRIAELYVDDQPRGREEVEVPADGDADVRFTTPKLGPGMHRAEVRLAGAPDPLPKDDRRYLTLDVQPALKVLVVTERPIDADFVVNALDPEILRAPGASRPYPVERVTPAQFASLNTPLREFGCVFLLNVADLTESDWGRLNQYVRAGGGLVIALGDRVVAGAYNDRAASLLPAQLGAVKPAPEAVFTFGKADVAHPLFEQNTRELLGELARVPVVKFYGVTPAEGARTLLSFQDGEPALLERVFPGPRAGRVLLWTTPLSRRPGTTAADRAAAWNEFPIEGWSFFALVNQTVPYMAGSAGRRLNYEAGEDVTLPLDPARRYTSFTIQGPGTQPDRLGDPASAAGLLITAPPLVGQWSVNASGGGSPPKVLGFSVNVPAGESQLTPITAEELAGLFGGADRFKLADDPDQLQRVVQETTYGRELFPLLMLAILVIVALENLLANTFYRERPAAAGAAPR